MSVENVDFIMGEIYNMPRSNDYNETEDKLEFLQEIAEEMKCNPNFYVDWNRCLADLRRENNFCPHCGESLSHATRKIPHSELCDSFDKEIPYETYTYEYCRLCGWNKDDND